VVDIQQHVDGHLNESVERRNRQRRRQQPGETFDDYLVAFRELAKTFVKMSVAKKGLIDTVEALLRRKGLTLEVTAKQRGEITGLYVLTRTSLPVAHVLGVGATFTQAGGDSALPTT
jgi:tRNA(Ile2) C34 agmatinyltransferase TiaS